MRRRKYRERRNSAWERKWLQRELEASGMILDGLPPRRIALPTSTTQFARIAVVETAPPKRRRRERPQEVRVLN